MVLGQGKIFCCGKQRVQGEEINVLTGKMLGIRNFRELKPLLGKDSAKLPRGQAHLLWARAASGLYKGSWQWPKSSHQVCDLVT